MEKPCSRLLEAGRLWPWPVVVPRHRQGELCGGDSSTGLGERLAPSKKLSLSVLLTRHDVWAAGPPHPGRLPSGLFCRELAFKAGVRSCSTQLPHPWLQAKAQAGKFSETWELGCPEKQGPMGPGQNRGLVRTRRRLSPLPNCQKNLGRAQKPLQGEVSCESFRSSGFPVEQEG